jgi:8-oxo-dGTP diphosphatase/2-hydroxy-dATP diphosphatase
MKKQLTLCMVCGDGRILLGMKKVGFGAGRWNGFGGKVEKGETVEAAAARELKEEAGIEASVDGGADAAAGAKTGSMQKVGILDFSFENDPVVLSVHIFKVTDFVGTPVESEEMRPQWFAFDAIPFKQMWIDDEQWIPYIIAGKKFKGSFLFDRPATADYSSKIIKQDLKEVQTLD